MFINVSITLLYQGFGRKQILLSSPSVPCEFNQDGLPLSPHSSAHPLSKSLSHSLTSSSLAIRLSKNSRVFVGMLHSVFVIPKRSFWLIHCVVYPSALLLGIGKRKARVVYALQFGVFVPGYRIFSIRIISISRSATTEIEYPSSSEGIFSG